MSHLPEKDNSGGKTWLKKNVLPNLPTVLLFDGSVPEDSAFPRFTNRAPHEPDDARTDDSRPGQFY